MRILGHVDPLVLEGELLARVDAAHATGAVGRTLVLVPTNRLAEHVLRRLAALRPAWLGLRVLPFAALGRDVLEQEVGRTLHVAHTRVLEALLRRLLHERPGNVWTRFVGRRPGAARRVLDTLTDLREAGIEPQELLDCAAGDSRADQLGELYAVYHAALERASEAGWTDTAGLARAARAHARSYGARQDAVFLHGAYEILGVYLDLIRELDEATDVTTLVPVAAGSRVTAHAERFAKSFLVGTGATFEAPRSVDERRAARLASLYDERRVPGSAPPDTFRFRHAQGAAAEVKYAVREALRAVSEGCPPTEIVLTARNLEPYAAALEEAFSDAELPWTTSLGSPLRRHRVVREFLLALRVVAERFPRDPTIELLHTRHLDWIAMGCEKKPPRALADRWSREAGIVDGLDDWTVWLERWATRPRERPEQTPEQRLQEEERARIRGEHARNIADALRRVDASVSREEATWGGHASALSEWLDSRFRSSDVRAVEQLHEILDVMTDLERLVGDTRPVDFDTMLAWLEDAVDSTRLTLSRDDGGGIRVLDALRMRGSTFRHVHLLGLNAGLFPRSPREDPVLPDRLRRALRERTGRPIGVESEANDEEHLLLVLLLGSAGERVDISWQRADESGRAKVASLALREVGRIASGSTDVEALQRGALHLPSHPEQWLESIVDRTGLLAPEERLLLAALRARAADAAEKLSRRFPELKAGLAMLRATQSFSLAGDAYDGRVGPIERDKPFSVTELETLGRCPLQFFFGGILRVDTLQDRADLFHLAPFELGTRIHDLLEQVYGTLRDEGLFDGGDTSWLRRRGLELIDARRENVLGEIASRMARRLPLLWNGLAATWFEAVRRFVEDDLRRIGDHGLRPESLEELASTSLGFGEGIEAAVRGKFDRLFRGATGAIVGDYKTSKSLSWRVQPTSMLKARALQVPLYQMMAGSGSTVELLGVHPELDPADGDHRHRFDGFGDERVAASFRHTMRVLLRLFDEGSYPFNDDAHCAWCDFQKACRRNHPPSVDRELQRADGDAFRKLQKKSKRSPHVR